MLKFDPPRRTAASTCCWAIQPVLEWRPTTCGPRRGSQCIRPYFVRARHGGQFPVDVNWTSRDTGASPGGRRMRPWWARRPVRSRPRANANLARLGGTTIRERTAEAIGDDMSSVRRKRSRKRLPWICSINGQTHSHLYVQMDGPGVGGRKRRGRQGKTRDPAIKGGGPLIFLMCCSPDYLDGKATRSAPDSPHYTGGHRNRGGSLAKHLSRRVAKRLSRAEEEGGHRRMAPNGSGIFVAEHFSGGHSRSILPCSPLCGRVARPAVSPRGSQQGSWMRVHQKGLWDKGKNRKIVALQAIVTANPQMAEKIAPRPDSLERNAGSGMRIPSFAASTLVIGSGVIEAGCKTVIGSSLKQSGRLWTVRGATPSWHTLTSSERSL